MIPHGSISLRRSFSDGALGYDNKCQYSYMKPVRCPTKMASILMGPVVASLALYVTERLLTRMMAGQLLRKGIYRKMRRLTGMMMEHSILADLLSDFLEELSDYFAGCV